MSEKTQKFFHGQWPEAPWKKEFSKEELEEAIRFDEVYATKVPSFGSTPTITPETAAEALDKFSKTYPEMAEWTRVMQEKRQRLVYLVKLIVPYAEAKQPTKSYMLRYDTIYVSSTLEKALEFIRLDTHLIKRDSFHFFTIVLVEVDAKIGSFAAEFSCHIGYYDTAGNSIAYPTERISKFLEKYHDS